MSQLIRSGVCMRLVPGSGNVDEWTSITATGCEKAVLRRYYVRIMMITLWGCEHKKPNVHDLAVRRVRIYALKAAEN